MDFRPLTTIERDQLVAALQKNATGDHAILMDSRTSFLGTSDDLPTDEEVVNAIKSVPCHYAGSLARNFLNWLIAVAMIVGLASIVKADEFSDKVDQLTAKKDCPCGCGCDAKCDCSKGGKCPDNCGCLVWYAADDDGCYALFHGKKQVGYLKHDGTYWKLNSSYGKDLWQKGKPPIPPPARKVTEVWTAQACRT